MLRITIMYIKYLIFVSHCIRNLALVPDAIVEAQHVMFTSVRVLLYGGVGLELNPCEPQVVECVDAIG